MKYEVRQGRLQTWALECQVVDHCNLRCAQCCTLSPHLPKRITDPATLERDLRALSEVLEPRLFKLTGGEPLLHPDLLGCLDAARASGIARQISLTTNDFLLKRAPEALFEGLDRITLSWYTSRELSGDVVAWIEDRCARHDVYLSLKPTSAFQELTVLPPGHQRSREVFDSCWMKWRCHSVRDGVFTVCTRPPHLRTWLAGQGIDHDIEEDGVDVHAPGLARRLEAYLERDRPLASCQYCLGDTGGWRDHAQLPRTDAQVV